MKSPASRGAHRILVVAPHADDETLGVGGTIARRAAEGHEIHVAVVTGLGRDPHARAPRSGGANRIRAEARRAIEVLGVRQLHFEEVPSTPTAEQPASHVNRTISALIENIQPDILYAPFPFELHKDHHQVFHALSMAWQSGVIGRKVRAVYCYEVQSERHGNAPHLAAGFTPNAWVDVSAHLDTKMRALACYESQLRPAPDARSMEAVRALAIWRGSQQGMAAAEAFVTVRLLE